MQIFSEGDYICVNVDECEIKGSNVSAISSLNKSYFPDLKISTTSIFCKIIRKTSVCSKLNKNYTYQYVIKSTMLEWGFAFIYQHQIKRHMTSEEIFVYLMES